jgi:hypothetical protein
MPIANGPIRHRQGLIWHTAQTSAVARLLRTSATNEVADIFFFRNTRGTTGPAVHAGGHHCDNKTPIKALISTQPGLLTRRQRGCSRANVKVFANRYFPLHSTTIVKDREENCSYSDIRRNPFVTVFPPKSAARNIKLDKISNVRMINVSANVEFLQE